MKRKRVFYGILLICLALLVVALFYFWPNPSPETNLIRFGYMPGNMNGAPFYIALVKGFFDEHNIKIETVPLSSGSEVKQAISAGQIDIAFAGASNFLIPISKGVPIKVIAPMSFTHTYLYVRPDNNTRTFKDLEGKSIAISPGGINEYEIRRILKKEKIDISEINFVNIIDKINRPIALMEKKIVDAVPIDYEDLAKYSELDAVPLEEWETKGYDNRYKLDTVIVVNEEFKRAHPLLVEQFIDGLIDGHRFMKLNPEESAATVSSYIETDTSGALVYVPENLNAMWENKILTFTLWDDPTVLIEMAEIAVEIGQIDSNLTLDQIYDLSFEKKLKDAQNEIYSTN
ncbi:ABC transporter substrate-binding protein [Patescibacteria group bacterium]|nr:ABC transporter substrate-binding protein [Patescibacteria group bacterium]MBU0963536.1 ABC transporter substrate-binding protein [Patescibacteria group bacterium]